MWTIDRHLLFDTRYGPEKDPEQILVCKGTPSDRDTYLFNWKEWDRVLRAICPCPAPVAHDDIWGKKQFVSGKPCSFEQSNRIYFDLGHSSTSPFRRLSSHSRDYLLGTRISRRRWDALEDESIPAEFAYLYGSTPAAKAARAAECWRIVTDPKSNRLKILPPVTRALQAA